MCSMSSVLVEKLVVLWVVAVELNPCYEVMTFFGMSLRCVISLVSWFMGSSLRGDS